MLLQARIRNHTPRPHQDALCHEKGHLLQNMCYLNYHVQLKNDIYVLVCVCVCVFCVLGVLGICWKDKVTVPFDITFGRVDRVKMVHFSSHALQSSSPNTTPVAVFLLAGYWGRSSEGSSQLWYHACLLLAVRVHQAVSC